MTTTPSMQEFPYRLAVRTAAVAAVFAAVVAALLVYDYWHRAMKDPSQTSYRETLKAAQKQQPDNKELNEKLRQLDAESRQEYFRQRWFTTVGAALLCGGVIVFLAAARWAIVLGRRPPLPKAVAAETDWQAGWTPAAQWTVAALFAILCAAGIGLAAPAWKTSRELAEQESLRADLQAASGATPANGAQGTGVSRNDGRDPPDRGAKGAPAAPPPPLSAEELARAWPCFRGRGGSGISPYANIPDEWDGPSGKNILWKTPVPLSGNSSPIVVAGRIFLTGGDKSRRQVYCFDAAGGKLLWEADQPSTPDSRKPIKDDEDVLAGYSSCTMATDGRYVAAIFANGDLAAYDLNGKPAWSKSLGIPENAYGHAASLSIYKDLLLVPFDQGEVKAAKAKLLALDIATGRVVWEQPRPVRASWTTPIVVRAAGRDQLVAVSDPWAIAYNPADGQELWRASMPHGDAAPSPAAAGDVVIAVVNDSWPIAAIRADGKGDVSATHVLWRSEDNGPDICSPLATEEFVFVLSSAGTLVCYDARKGDKLWEEEFSDFRCKPSPSLVGKQLYLLGEDGKCWIVVPSRSGVKRVRQVNLGEPCLACPAFQDGRMFVRGEKSLFCIGKK